MAHVTVSNLQELEAYKGKELGVSDWHVVTQDQVNQFADGTLDHQWIHIDVEKATKESPFGGPIAHGYLTISMAPFLLSQIVEVKGLKMGVNYGIETLRFVEPVKVGAKLRLKAELKDVKNLRGTGKSTFKLTFELEGVKKPACTAEVVYLYSFED
jgi:acyl dehydratase